MLAYLQTLSFWDWLALGTLLLIFEVFGAGGYLLWIGLAAAFVGAMTFLIPGLSWEVQLFLFGLLSVLTALYWWRRQRSVARPSDQPNLNLRGQELIGKTFVVHQAIINGRGRIKVADGVWIAKGADAPVGSRVRVIGQEGAVLLVENLD
ncbi:NfeD family protein [Pseudomonas sp. TKO26]|uniref:NfeD-like C-terminal domain-containing protein n=1 Tax=Pseudomonas saponiphila TaxID=556534 RepID=A0A1H4J3R4_9PSED|nr:MULTISPECIES: NfeD family protein [Pseudomonas]PYY80133.1 NfeD family protein [Pseudomonas sp. TKO30]PYY81438.1 NfeD family protein [Pseudomonas sp. TKO29]PYY83282.1 NfeD family protein [Pseudomonas sp. TKO26]PYY97402.1 NfeD family protein [Pseudomonas sp. TKO14]SEB40979.1 hypothetical protein SAMN05216178_0042 [Pseudomonas saponiphila]